MLKSNRYQHYYQYCEKQIDFDPKNSQKWANFGPIWTRFGPGSQTQVWTLYHSVSCLSEGIFRYLKQQVPKISLKFAPVDNGNWAECFFGTHPHEAYQSVKRYSYSNSHLKVVINKLNQRYSMLSNCMDHIRRHPLGSKPNHEAPNACRLIT